MKPIDFKGRNRVFAKDQPEYIPLHAHISPGGIVTSCWKMSFKERLKVLMMGEVWSQLLTFNKPLQPQLLSVDNPVTEKEKEE